MVKCCILTYDIVVMRSGKYEQNNKRFNNRSTPYHLLNVPFDDGNYYFMNYVAVCWGVSKAFCCDLRLECTDKAIRERKIINSECVCALLMSFPRFALLITS